MRLLQCVWHRLYYPVSFLILSLALKSLTPVFVITYYFLLEEYKASDFRFEGFVVYLIELVVFWHIFSRLMRACFEID